MPESQIPKRGETASEENEDGLDLWACNWPALQIFRAMKTQWRAVALPMGLAPGRLHYLGMDYAALPVVERRLKVHCDTDTLTALQVMEVEGAEILNED